MVCDACGGQGRVVNVAGERVMICTTCGGCGNVPSAKRLADYPCAPVECPDCGGNGKRGGENGAACPECGGKKGGQDAAE